MAGPVEGEIEGNRLDGQFIQQSANASVVYPQDQLQGSIPMVFVSIYSLDIDCKV